jgi:hypothetical protein
MEKGPDTLPSGSEENLVIVNGNAPFSVTTFQECDTESKFADVQNQYQQGFLDGCISVEGNTREICETAIE